MQWKGILSNFLLLKLSEFQIELRKKIESCENKTFYQSLEAFNSLPKTHLIVIHFKQLSCTLIKTLKVILNLLLLSDYRL